MEFGVNVCLCRRGRSGFVLVSHGEVGVPPREGRHGEDSPALGKEYSRLKGQRRQLQFHPFRCVVGPERESGIQGISQQYGKPGVFPAGLFHAGRDICAGIQSESGFLLFKSCPQGNFGGYVTLSQARHECQPFRRLPAFHREIQDDIMGQPGRIRNFPLRRQSEGYLPGQGGYTPGVWDIWHGFD